MSSEVWSIVLQKHSKIIQHHVHIRSTDQFKQVGVREKIERNKTNSVNDHRFWLCIGATFSAWIGKVFKLTAD